MTHGATHTIPHVSGQRNLLLVGTLVLALVVVTNAVHVDFRVAAPVLTFVLLAGLAQLFLGNLPSVAATLMGSVAFPVSAYINPLFDGRLRVQPIGAMDLLCLAACGSLAGYCCGILLAEFFQLAESWQPDRTQKVYAVPRRFGMSTILIATTVFAVVFAMMEYARARPWQMFFFTSFVATVSVAQAVLNRNPRWASMLSGAVYLPLSLVLFGSFISMGRRSELPRLRLDRPQEAITLLLTFAVMGLLIGYLGGALIAGVFLLSDYVARFFHAPRSVPLPLEPRADEELLPSGSLSILAERAAANRRQ